jgi:hypothetical protein
LNGGQRPLLDAAERQHNTIRQVPLKMAVRYRVSVAPRTAFC